MTNEGNFNMFLKEKHTSTAGYEPFEGQYRGYVVNATAVGECPMTMRKWLVEYKRVDDEDVCMILSTLAKKNRKHSSAQ